MSHSVELRWYLHFVRRHLVLVAALALAGAAAGGVTVLTRPPSFTATVFVLASDQPISLGENQLDDSTTVLPPTLDTEAAIVRSEPVVARVRTVLPGASRSDVLDSLTITAPEHTRVLRLRFRWTSAAGAQRAVDEATQGYLEARAAITKSVRDELVTLLAQHSAELARLSLADNRGLRRARAQRRYEVAAVDRLEVQLHAFDTAERVPGQVTARPAVVETTRTNKQVPVTGGFLLGLLAGLAAGGLRDRRRRPDALAGVLGTSRLESPPGRLRRASAHRRSDELGRALALRLSRSDVGPVVVVTGSGLRNVLGVSARLAEDLEAREVSTAVVSDTARLQPEGRTNQRSTVTVGRSSWLGDAVVSSWFTGRLPQCVLAVTDDVAEVDDLVSGLSTDMSLVTDVVVVSDRRASPGPVADRVRALLDLGARVHVVQLEGRRLLQLSAPLREHGRRARERELAGGHR